MSSREEFFIRVSISVILGISMPARLVIVFIVRMLICNNQVFSMLLHHI